MCKCPLSLRSGRPEVFCEKVFLEILQNPQENKYAGLSFLIKWQAYSLQTLSKNDTLAHVTYCEICE